MAHSIFLASSRQKYPQEELLAWDNDISIFADFGAAISSSLEKDSTDKMKEAFW